MPIPRECSSVDTIITNLCRLPGCGARKTHGDAFEEQGFPDVLGARFGRMFLLEVKRTGRKPTPKQKHTLQLWWRAAGVPSGTVTSWPEAREFLYRHGLMSDSEYRGQGDGDAFE